MIAAFVAAACADPAVPTVRERLEATVRDQPDLPVAVPVEVPGPYELNSFEPAQRNSRTGVSIDSQWTYQQTEASRDAGELPVIEVCVVRRGSPWTCLPRERAIAVRRVEGLDAAVYAIGPGELTPESEWRDVELTTQWRDLDWLK